VLQPGLQPVLQPKQRQVAPLLALEPPALLTQLLKSQLLQLCVYSVSCVFIIDSSPCCDFVLIHYLLQYVATCWGRAARIQIHYLFLTLLALLLENELYLSSIHSVYDRCIL